MSNAPPLPPSVRPEPVVAGLSGLPASVPAAQKARAPPLSGLPADLGRLLATKEGADVDLEMRGKVFAAHKSVLTARSPVFMQELFGTAKEEDTSYVRIIPDMRPEAFEVLLHYLYTDTLPPEMAMNSLEEGVVLTEDLLAAADRYDLKDLKLLTEKKMCNHVGVSTVLPMLGLAERYQCCKLKKMCLGFIGSCGNTSAVMATNGLEILARSSPSIIKDVITEILDAREARRMRLINFSIFALCFILPFLLYAIFS
jgi:speckle-type POZ protein